VDVGLARALKAAGKGALFIVNDDPAVALAAEADGVHVGLEDLPVAEAKRLGVGIVGATSHTLGEARRAAKAGADYVSVGPMYATPLKPGLAPKGASYLAGVKRLGIPWFCVGGITASNARRAFGRVAVCSAVIGAKDPAAAARAIRAKLT
jgi:thiamine-phosphate pyrophosphorylase